MSLPSLSAGRTHVNDQPEGPCELRAEFVGRRKGGPRESPETGFHSFPAEEKGRKVRERSASFSDHYSQARQFYISQSKSEQGHIADALVFELSKVQKLAIRERLVSHLPNIDVKSADRIAFRGKKSGRLSDRRRGYCAPECVNERSGNRRSIA